MLSTLTDVRFPLRDLTLPSIYISACFELDKVFSQGMIGNPHSLLALEGRLLKNIGNARKDKSLQELANVCAVAG